MEIKRVDDVIYIKIPYEDHTLGNVLRYELIKHSDIIYCGYQYNDGILEIKIRNKHNDDVSLYINNLIETLDKLIQSV